MIKSGKIKTKSKKIKLDLLVLKKFQFLTILLKEQQLPLVLRNITNRDVALKEIFRILKPGGRFICLSLAMLRMILLKKYMIFGLLNACLLLEKKLLEIKSAYTYLVESIRKFPNQSELSEMFSEAGFSRVRVSKLI